MNDPRPLTPILLLMAVVGLPMAALSTALAASAMDAESQARARVLAQSVAWPQPRTRANDIHPLGVQTLSVEKQESKASPATPLVRVYQFHYPLRQARLVVVNPDTRLVMNTSPLNSVHLPLSDSEIAYAGTLLERQTSLIATLRSEQSKRGKAAFKTLSELDVKASIYEPHDTSHPCHRQRCALMSLFDDTNTVFSTEPIVNLQAMQVLLPDTR